MLLLCSSGIISKAIGVTIGSVVDIDDGKTTPDKQLKNIARMQMYKIPLFAYFIVGETNLSYSQAGYYVKSLFFSCCLLHIQDSEDFS